MYYQSWKYWHNAELRIKIITIMVAYDMYRDFAEGDFHVDWKLDAPVSWWEFHNKLVIQGTAYDPCKKIYPSDKQIRRTTQVHKKRRTTEEVSKSNNIATIENLNTFLRKDHKETPKNL